MGPKGWRWSAAGAAGLYGFAYLLPAIDLGGFAPGWLGVHLAWLSVYGAVSFVGENTPAWVICVLGLTANVAMVSAIAGFLWGLRRRSRYRWTLVFCTISAPASAASILVWSAIESGLWEKWRVGALAWVASPVLLGMSCRRLNGFVEAPLRGFSVVPIPSAVPVVPAVKPAKVVVMSEPATLED